MVHGLGRRRTAAAAVVAAAMLIAAGVVVPALASGTTSLTGGACSGSGASGRVGSTGQSWTINSCEGASWRWLHSVMYDNQGNVLDDFNKGWTTSGDWYVADSSGGVDRIQAGHEICDTVPTCGSPGYTNWP